VKRSSFFTVVFENDHCIVVNKASGISVGGERWDDSAQRLDKLVADSLSYAKIFTVHRIDRETSGLVAFAKDAQTHKQLSMAFNSRQVGKHYIAVVHGRPAWEEMTCDLPLVPNGNKKHMTIIDKYRGKESHTQFKVLNSAGNYSVLSVYPATGRIHQIRVHAASLGFPVVCDSLYGKETPVLLSSFKRGWRGDPHEEKPLLARLGLHAMELSLPADLCGYKLSAPLSRDLAALIKQIEKLDKRRVDNSSLQT